ncbi:MAG: CcmD family protein [Candidatus Kapabacteria bacterium]|nr:CcmD family protein [Candidatus Kapabacteria bacterium]
MITFLTEQPMYVVLVTAMMIWAGIAWYLNRLDRKVSDLEQRVK